MGLVDIPAGTRDPRAQNYIVDHVRPGTTVKRRIQVCNGTSKLLTLKLYAAAATIGQGTFKVVGGRSGNELTGWSSVTPSSLTIAPGQRVLAVAKIVVPTTAEPGERYAALLAELPAAQQGSGISVADRVGVRVYLDVGPGGSPKSDFVVDSLQAVRRADGTPAVLAQVRNTGARALDLRGDLRLTEGPGGLSGGPFPVQVGTTLGPGDSAPVTVPLPAAITGGPWLATIDMRSGLLERKASARVTFPDRAGAQEPAVRATPLAPYKDKNVLVPLAGGLIGLLLLVLLVVGYLTSRRRARERAAR